MSEAIAMLERLKERLDEPFPVLDDAYTTAIGRIELARAQIPCVLAALQRESPSGVLTIRRLHRRNRQLLDALSAYIRISPNVNGDPSMLFRAVLPDGTMSYAETPEVLIERIVQAAVDVRPEVVNRAEGAYPYLTNRYHDRVTS